MLIGQSIYLVHILYGSLAKWDYNCFLKKNSCWTKGNSFDYSEVKRQANILLNENHETRKKMAQSISISVLWSLAKAETSAELKDV